MPDSETSSSQSVAPVAATPTPALASNPTLDRLVLAVEKAYHRPGLMLWRSFLQGMMAALGATVGTALVLALLVWVFHILGGIELLRPTVEGIQDIIIPEELLNPDANSN